MADALLGIIGGSGLYQMESLAENEEVSIDTPFGRPSDAITVGKIAGTSVAFLPRHGRGHRISPTELPVRANIWALKSLGVKWVISVSAVGSLREDIEPVHLVVPNQLIDRTRSRVNSFFEDGVVVHCGFAEPYCPVLSGLVYEAARDSGATVHRGGTLVVMEGPQFSTRAESFLYRSWGADIIGMTALPEAKLAREAEIGYATLACVTDYDCWHDGHHSVTVDMIVANLLRNVERSKDVVRRVAERLTLELESPFANALQNAIITDRASIGPELRERYGLLIGKYL